MMMGSRWFLDLYPNGQGDTTNSCFYLNLVEQDKFFCCKYKMYLEGLSPTSLSMVNCQRNIFKEKGSYGWHGQRFESGSYHAHVENGHICLKLEMWIVQPM